MNLQRDLLRTSRCAIVCVDSTIFGVKNPFRHPIFAISNLLGHAQFKFCVHAVQWPAPVVR